VALRTTCIKLRFKIIKVRTSCHYLGYFYYSENQNWAGLDIADLAFLVAELWPKLHKLMGNS